MPRRGMCLMLAGLALGQPESRRPREAPVPRELPISRAQAQAYWKFTVAEVCVSAPTIVCRNELGVNPLLSPANTFPKASRGGAPRANNATLLFVHVPKTAGSSMKRVLERVQDIPFFFCHEFILFTPRHPSCFAQRP